MTGDARATRFVTEDAGFIGNELVKVLVTGGHQVLGLTESMEAAGRVRRAGAVPVIGDLLTGLRPQLPPTATNRSLGVEWHSE
jgi:nucleoside-diphosphate-sugar epimerase